MKILRRIFGPVCENYLCWRLRYNEELCELFDGLDIVKYIEFKDYMGRPHNSKILKKVLVGKFHGRRHVGKPRLRWVDNIRRDASLLLSIRGWRRIARNRDNRRQTTEEASTQCRLSHYERIIIKK